MFIDSQLLSRILYWLLHEGREPRPADFQVSKEDFEQAVDGLCKMKLVEIPPMPHGSSTRSSRRLLGRARVTLRGYEYCRFFLHAQESPSSKRLSS